MGSQPNIVYDADVLVGLGGELVISPVAQDGAVSLIGLGRRAAACPVSMEAAAET